MHSYPYPPSVLDNLVSTPVLDHYSKVYGKPVLSTFVDIPYWVTLTSVSVFVSTLSGPGFTSFMASMGLGLGMAQGLFLFGVALKISSWIGNWLWKKFF